MREAELVYGLIEDGYTEGLTPTDFTKHLHYLRGARGAVSFSYTFVNDPVASKAAWLSDRDGRVRGDRDEELWDKYLALMATGVDIHSPEPLFPGQTRMPMCLALGRKEGCYTDGSSLRAQGWLEEFQSYGMEWLREALTDEYHYRFYSHEYELLPEERVLRMGLAETAISLGKLLDGL